jgi:hypothetical protein
MMRPIIRQTAVAALRRRTLAEVRVFDSDNTPLLDALKDIDQGPYITVYTDDDTRSNIQGRDLSTSDRNISLVLEIGIASRVVLPAVDGTDPIPELQLPATDEVMELTIDIVEAQAIKALFTDPQSEWGQLLNEMVGGIHRAPSMRGAQADKGTRYAARQISFQLINTIADPVPGIVLDDYHPIAKFLALAASDTGAGIKTAGEIIGRFVNDTASPDWRTAQSWLALTQQGIRALGIAPLSAVAPDEEGAMLDTPDGSINPLTDDSLPDFPKDPA